MTKPRVPGRCGCAERGTHSPATPAWQRAVPGGQFLVAFFAQQSQAGPYGAEECKEGGGPGPNCSCGKPKRAPMLEGPNSCLC